MARERWILPLVVFGSCPGREICQGAAGLACVGQTPAAEACNYGDDDCDGQTDEGFADELGRYVSDGDCGVCGNDCSGFFPNAVSGCALQDGAPQKPPEGTEIGDSPAGKRVGDAEATGRAFEDQAWFAKLPPELRKSIRAGAQQKAPRAYEDKLRRYFQSVE